VVGLTYTPPLLPSLAAPVAAGGNASQIIAEVLSARGPGAVQDSLAETLQSASGPGNVITGTVTATASDGSVTLTTANGTQISLHHPPELTLNLGSVVTLRIATGGTTPQATILQVDGRPITARPGTAPPPTSPQPGTPATPMPPTLLGSPLPGTDSGSAYAATLAAVLSLDEAAALEAGYTEAPVLTPGAFAPAPETDFLTEAVIAVLIRPAPARPGLTPLPVGTRYLLLPPDPTDDTSGSATGRLAMATTTADALEAELAALLPAGEAADFEAQSAILAGHIVASPDPEQTLVETAIGTLSLPAAAAPPIGSAVRLRVVAVALPKAEALSSAEPAEERGLLDEILDLLTGRSSSAGSAAMTQLTLPPDARLLAAVWAFIADPQRAVRARESLAQIRKSLIEAGRDDLAERVEAVAGDVGEDRAAPGPETWTMLMLPFFGTGTERPPVLYTKPPGKNRGEREKQAEAGEHFVLEVELRRLGAFQFDGLIRPRRLDLMLRTATPLPPDLAAGIERTFRDAVGACGWSGDIGFGRLGKFPLAAAPPAPRGIAINA
jgi:hypothetical protein